MMNAGIDISGCGTYCVKCVYMHPVHVYFLRGSWIDNVFPLLLTRQAIFDVLDQSNNARIMVEVRANASV